jgi:poly(3-hydroxybutyrate) depolymerase
MGYLLFVTAFIAVSRVVAGPFGTCRSGPIPELELAGCGKSLPSGQAVGKVSYITIRSGGYQRSYNISIPATYNAVVQTPLILSYHGGEMNAEDQMNLDELTNPNFNNVSIVVYPQGINV